MRTYTRKPEAKTLLPYHIGALVAVTMWGTSFVSTKVLLDAGLHPVEIYIYRFLLAYMLVFCFCHKKFFSDSLVDELLFGVCGLCAGSIYFIAENTALNYTLVSNVSLLTTLTPLLTTLLIGALYRAERPGRWVYFGSMVAFIGVGCIIFKQGLSFEVKPLGDLLAILAAFSWAVYSVVLRKLNVTYTSWFITRKTFFYGLVTALPFLAIEPEIASPVILLETRVWTNLLFLGVGCSMISYLIWAATSSKLGAVKNSNYLYVQPIVTMIVSAIVFTDDPITLVGCFGCALIIGGVWVGDYMTARNG